MATQSTPPKKPPTAFIMYSNDLRENLKKEYPNKKGKQITKMISSRWQKESDEVKEKYNRQHADALKKYEQEYKEYWDSLPQEEREKIEKKKERKTEINVGDRRRATRNNPNAEEPPSKRQRQSVKAKKPRSAFMFYQAEKRDEVKEKHPKAKGSKVNKILGQMWRELTEEEAKRYHDMHDKDKERYEKEAQENGEKVKQHEEKSGGEEEEGDEEDKSDE
eukprot:gb/GECH01011649.1/.p1 GENE.gb/GECH01011649.1/~~gb/GECH01011649.1/.p1  ORF type:complete len:220 (+),score=72.66 gb/GECH01011649.1/:1-660(+)